MGGEVIEQNAGKKNSIQVKDLSRRQISHDDRVNEERKCKGEHEIFTCGKAEQVADDLRVGSHGGHALVIKQSGFAFLSGTSGHSSGSKKHKDESLYAKQPGESFSGSVYGRGFPFFPAFRFFIVNPLAVGTFEISSEISEARQD